MLKRLNALLISALAAAIDGLDGESFESANVQAGERRHRRPVSVGWVSNRVHGSLSGQSEDVSGQGWGQTRQTTHPHAD